MDPIREPVIIGADGWEARLRAMTSELSDCFWSGFTPVGLEEIHSLETSIKRTLPSDFRCFLNAIGVGDFPDEYGGGFFSPAEIIDGCAGPLLMLLGSDSWATTEEQKAFYISRGEINPNPAKFVNDVTSYSGINLLDLVQIGYDGMSCYYQVFCDSASSDAGFCRITPEQTLEDRCRSFSEGLWLILSRFYELRES